MKASHITPGARIILRDGKSIVTAHSIIPTRDVQCDPPSIISLSIWWDIGGGVLRYGVYLPDENIEVVT